MKKEANHKLIVYARNFIFGIEDSLVSTVGLLSGIAVAGMSRRAIILTGIVLIFVEAFSMGAGSLASEYSADTLVGKQKSTLKSFYTGAIIMFVSYFMAGFVPLAPYILTEPKTAFLLSIAASLVGLFILGAVNAKMFKGKILKNAVQMFLIGGTATAVGIIVGKLVENIK